MAALRIALRDVATRDFLRSELRSLLEELDEPPGRDRPSDGLEPLEREDPRDRDRADCARPARDRRPRARGAGLRPGSDLPISPR